MKAIDPGAFDVIATFSATSAEALREAQRLDEAWIRYFAATGPEPDRDWIVEVEALQQRKASDLEAARMHLAGKLEAVGPDLGEQPPLPETAPSPPQTAPESAPIGRIRKRRSRNKLLRSLGTPGQRALRLLLQILVLMTGLIAGAGAISLALEVAGFLKLIDDPVQLPFGSQTIIFIVGVVAFIASRKMLRAVERALYGSKGVAASRLPL